MTEPGTPTFDQIRLFLAVVETGSFGAAGRKLNRAVSVVSYGIANLEDQLQIRLFDRVGTRKPTLTREGAAILAEVRALDHGIDALKAKVRGLLQGLEAELSIAVDVMLSSAVLGRVLEDFRATFPTVALRLNVEALGAVTAKVLDGSANFAINGPLAVGRERLEVVAAGAVPLVPVAAPQHPLAQPGRVAPGAAREHVQLVLTDRSPLTEGQDFAVHSPRTWRLADLGAKHALLRQGIGWGNMPVPMVEEDLADGRLVRLVIPEYGGESYPLHAIHRSDTPPGPAGAWLLDRFVSALA